MVEPPAAASSRVAEQDVLLATKLHVPCAQPGFVPRARLVEALEEGLGRRLVLVCARPGPARRPCWPTGPGAASGRWRGCRWTQPTTFRHGFGATPPLRWTG